MPSHLTKKFFFRHNVQFSLMKKEFVSYDPVETTSSWVTVNQASIFENHVC